MWWLSRVSTVVGGIINGFIVGWNFVQCMKWVILIVIVYVFRFWLGRYLFVVYGEGCFFCLIVISIVFIHLMIISRLFLLHFGVCLSGSLLVWF